MSFVVDLPLISERRLAIVKCVAKHSVLTPELELGNHDFLNPAHKLHSLYLTYVDQYKRIQSGAKPPKGSVLERSIKRAKTLKPTKVSKGGLDLENDDYNFLVLETVTFFKSDLNGSSVLSAPLNLNDMMLERSEQTNELQFKSPFTNELVPASKFNEHIKIHQYKETVKQKTTSTESNLDTQNAADNLFRLEAKKRRLDHVD